MDEFEEAHLEAKPSVKVKPPGVAGSIAWAECVLLEEVVRERFVLVIGKVVHLEVDERFFNSDGDMDFESAKPLGVMLGSDGLRFTYPVYSGRYATYSDIFQ